MLDVPARVVEAEIVSVQGHAASLGPIEQQIVFLPSDGRWETIGDIPMPRRMWSQLLATHPPSRLADSQLETLHMICILCRFDRR